MLAPCEEQHDIIIYHDPCKYESWTGASEDVIDVDYYVDLVGGQEGHFEKCIRIGDLFHELCAPTTGGLARSTTPCGSDRGAASAAAAAAAAAGADCQRLGYSLELQRRASPPPHGPPLQSRL